MKTLIISLASLVFSLSAGQAAQIDGSSRNNCGMVIDGPIVEGDYDRFLIVTANEGFDGSDYKGETANFQKDAVCLNSPGGSVAEGRQIAKKIHEFGLPTRIEAGAECYSICAIMFMAGHMVGDEMDFPSRSLSTKGKLGFHAPYFSLEEDAQFSATEVAQMARLVNLTISDLIKFGSYNGDFDYQPAFSAVLMGEFLAFDHDEVYEIDTVEKVARWRIELIDAVTDLPIDANGIAQLCLNAEGWLLDRKATVAPNMSAGTSVSEQVLDGGYNGPATYYDVSTGGMEARGCLVKKPKGKYSSGFALCTYNNFNGTNFGSCPTHPLHMPSYYMLPGDTEILELTSD